MIYAVAPLNVLPGSEDLPHINYIKARNTRELETPDITPCDKITDREKNSEKQSKKKPGGATPLLLGSSIQQPR